jgi:hypothetical protein
MAIVQPMGTGQIDRIEGSGASLVILIAMVILFAAATYFTGSLYGKAGYLAGAAFVIILVGLMVGEGIFG